MSTRAATGLRPSTTPGMVPPLSLLTENTHHRRAKHLRACSVDETAGGQWRATPCSYQRQYIMCHQIAPTRSSSASPLSPAVVATTGTLSGLVLVATAALLVCKPHWRTAVVRLVWRPSPLLAEHTGVVNPPPSSGSLVGKKEGMQLVRVEQTMNI